MKSLQKYNVFKDWAIYENLNETIHNCNIYMKKIEKKKNDQ
jgi:hypothetical protein